MAPPRSELDALLREERLTTARSWLIGLGVVGALLAFVVVALLPGETRELTGIVVGLHGSTSEEGHDLSIKVRLGSGAEVLARSGRTVPVLRGQLARISATASRFGSATRYRFLGYVN